MNQAIEGIKISTRKFNQLKKCGLCGRVREIYYKMSVSDVENLELLAGELDLCYECGNNFNKILGNEFNADEVVVESWTF